MKTYTCDDVMKVAKRVKNTKRGYLFVNPLQAKHIPVSPTSSLTMMRSLGEMLAKKYPRTKLVIGFAETATAIGAVVAESFATDCFYIHTTRESVLGAMDCLCFLEEHSHAPEQKLIVDSVSERIASTDSIIFIDDEISTGKTMINMVQQLRNRFPQLNRKTIIAASLLNSMSMENMQNMVCAGIISEYLIKLPERDYTSEVQNIIVREASSATPRKLDVRYQALFCDSFQDARKGVYIRQYRHKCREVAETFLAQFVQKIRKNASILVLGTEECMYPALIIGEVLEQLGSSCCVKCHATTRSPIGICSADNYPIVNGYRITSFYENDRGSYIYNLCAYDVIIVVTDARENQAEAFETLAGAFPDSSSSQFFYIQSGKHVWYTQSDHRN